MSSIGAFHKGGYILVGYFLSGTCFSLDLAVGRKGRRKAGREEGREERRKGGRKGTGVSVAFVASSWEERKEGSKERRKEECKEV